MKKVLIIGANGYIGRHIAYFLKQQQVEFVPADKAEASVDGYENYISVDVTSREALSALDFQVDTVFMFAGLTGTQNDEESVKRYTEVNEGGLKNVLECCRTNRPRVVFPSSRLVYKGQKEVFLKEDAEKEAKTVYAQNKINCEAMLEHYDREYNIPYTIFRVCVPYGNLIDDTYSYGTLGFFLSKAMAGQNITLYGSGEQKRTFTHVSDIVHLMLRTLENNPNSNDVYNIGSPDAKSLLEVANLVAAKFLVQVDHIEWPAEALKIESGDTIFDDTRILAATNYNYQFTLKRWIEAIDL